METPTEIQIANRYTGPGLKQVGIIAASIFGLIVLIGTACYIFEGKNKRTEPLAAAVAPATLEQVTQSPSGVPERLSGIDKELAAWQPTGRVEDLNRKLALQKERQQLAGQDYQAPVVLVQTPVSTETQTRAKPPEIVIARAPKQYSFASPTPRRVSESVLYQRHLKAEMREIVHPSD